MTTVVDALVVSLGLDPKGFKKGAADAGKAVKDTEATVTKSAGSMVSSLHRVAVEFIGLFVAVRSVQDVVGFFEKLNASTRQLGIDSKNYGVAASELQNWKNIAELAGGNAEDVTKTIGNLQQALFNLRYKGQFSDQLQFLARLGVQFQTTTGQMVPFKNIMLQTAAIMEKNGRPREENYQFLKASGFDEGSINAILSGTAALKAYIAEQEKMPQVSAAQTAAAARMGRAWDALKQKVTASAREILTKSEPAISALMGLLNQAADWVNDHQDDIARWFKDAVDWLGGPGPGEIKSFFKDLATVVRALADGVVFLTEKWGALPSFGEVINSSPLGAPIKVARWIWSTIGGRTRGERNNNPGNLKAAGDQPHDEEGFRVFATKEEGIAAANKQLDIYASRGVNTISSIVNTWAPASDNNNVAAYIEALKKSTGKGANELLSQADRAALLQGIFAHESGASAAGSRDIAQTLGPNPNALNAARGAQPTPAMQAIGPPLSSTAGSRSTNVQIDGITINTQATDADRIATDIDRAVQRKFMVAHAEAGLA